MVHYGTLWYTMVPNVQYNGIVCVVYMIGTGTRYSIVINPCQCTNHTRAGRGCGEGALAPGVDGQPGPVARARAVLCVAGDFVRVRVPPKPQTRDAGQSQGAHRRHE